MPVATFTSQYYRRPRQPTAGVLVASRPRSQSPHTVIKHVQPPDKFVETENAYVDGLQFAYAHFLMPILASLNSVNTPFVVDACLSSRPWSPLVRGLRVLSPLVMTG
jgi:hypothetical protein